ncbi:glucose-1-phosphate thymidylyltransferase RfbA [Candidatus Methylacidithermus pantelleriae]|uniref:Glucose-1-phosphate thymidylyltransferase n=1 Tax=Candidatus Methylacidithermus pantelleriae TaxID=2744239 RepID=A0A8J2BMD3_9BACT|nr:glucose-1-phosphate thymidylyltransferase RfbA [Candidatus Methylacidithermus pantelleriae]CAF0689559.1 dTDP-glucose pyrophosphorylase 2 [Candidatus Methylacidithermus pantelleriae]
MGESLVESSSPIQRRGIVLAGGSGTRLYPVTRAVSKQLMPVYDKPMVYYPISVLMLANIRTILLISTPADLPVFQRLLKDGSQFGIQISYALQPEPRGLAEAYLIGAEFLRGFPSCLILGDNLFYGHNLTSILYQASLRKRGATIFAYRVANPSAYGVVELGPDGKALSLEEKPSKPRSPYAIPGIYFCDERAPAFASRLRPSTRGELEITDLLRFYLEEGSLHVELLGRGTAWMDTGTPDALHEASSFVRAIEHRQGLKVACLEEIAYAKGWIDEEILERQALLYGNSSYGAYLRFLLHSEAGQNSWE